MKVVSGHCWYHGANFAHNSAVTHGGRLPVAGLELSYVLNMLTLGLVPTCDENASEIPSHFVDTEVEA